MLTAQMENDLYNQTYDRFKKPFKPTINYDKSIVSITPSKDGSYIVEKKNGEKENIDTYTTIYTIVGIYTHYLLHKGSVSSKIEAVNKPTTLFTHLTCSGEANSTPILNKEETLECLEHITQGLFRFRNKNCKNYEPAYGIGCLIYLLCEPYLILKDFEVAERFYIAIANGLFSFQMRCKPLARSLYIGLYSVWEGARNTHDFYYTKSSSTLKECCENIFECEDVFFDPMHSKPAKYPQCLYYYSADLLFFTRAAAEVLKEIPDPTPKNNIRDVSYALIYEYCIDSIYYSMECYREAADSLNRVKRTDGKFVGESQGSYIKHWSKLSREHYKDILYQDAPYIAYTREIVYEYRADMMIATKIIEKNALIPAQKADRDCLIFGEREIAIRERNKLIDDRSHTITLILGSAFLFLIGMGILVGFFYWIGKVLFNFGGGWLLTCIGVFSLLGIPFCFIAKNNDKSNFGFYLGDDGKTHTGWRL